MPLRRKDSINKECGVHMLRVFIDEKSYKNFIRYAIKTCETFSFVFNKEDDEAYDYNDFYLNLRAYIISEKRIMYHSDMGTYFANAIIAYFKCCKETNGILQAADSVLDWNADALPGELCFYRNGQKWFTCVCHARCMFVHNETKTDVLFFEKTNIQYRQEK